MTLHVACMTRQVFVFAEPTQLPPTREVDHYIPLKEWTEPVNIRSYRYAYFQKEEIEKQVQEMDNQGIIRPSTSPFSSPMLLVKKKYGSWRFCTDYRALNTMTIKERFPIPTIEYMMSKLHGATYFTKLDLKVGYHQVRVRVHSPDIPKTFIKQLLEHIIATTNIWSCLLAYAIPHLPSKQSWILSFNPILENISSSLMTFNL